MPDDVIYFDNIDQLITKLTDIFKDLDPRELRDVLFFLDHFRKEKLIPADTLVYVTTIPLEGLEVESRDKVSEVIVGGVKKYQSIKAPTKRLPPIVVLKGSIRLVVVHGELTAVEAYAKSISIKAIILDVEDRDPFETFNIDPTRAVFLIPVIEEAMKKEGILLP